jgi:hypothetical protein
MLVLSLTYYNVKVKKKLKDNLLNEFVNFATQTN